MNHLRTWHTNFTSVNSLNENELYLKRKERGTGDRKRVWGIEMNMARHVYLSTYGVIDTIDSLVKNCRIGYRSWKYWHAAKNHGYALVIVMAYGMYKEVLLEAYEEFGIERSVATKLCLDFHGFRERLAMQGLQYDPKNCGYPGDEKMRAITKLNKSARCRKRKEPTVDASGLVTPEQFRKAKNSLVRTGGVSKGKTRLCGSLTTYLEHLESVETRRGAWICAYCGYECYTRCGICGIPAHNNPQRGDHAGKQCFLYLHNDDYYGLARCDTVLKGYAKQHWVPPLARFC